jgi:peptide/nickel transport system substrate-binding protein
MRRLWLVIIGLTLAACGTVPTPNAPVLNTLTYGLTLDPSGFDPHIHSSSEIGIVLRQVYDTLVYRDPQTGEFVPGLAVQWAISEDQMTYTFRLRQDVRFHDGTPFNAQAVAVNLDRIVNLETASQRAVFMLGSYTGYELVDEYTIALQLEAPYSPLLDSLSQPYLGIASPAALASYSKERYQFHQVGTGPYKYVDFIPGTHVILERNPNYTWGPSFYTTPASNPVERVEFRFFTDPVARGLALESGEVEIMGELLPADARTLGANAALQILPVEIPGQPLQFMMNTAQYPTDTLAVRQALILGANREEIANLVFEAFSPVAWGPLSQTTAFYSTGVINRYSHDAQAARDLLESLGYIDSDNDGFYDISGVKLIVQVIVPPWGLSPEVAQVLQNQWRVIGVDSVLKTAPTFSAVLEEVEAAEYNLVAFNGFGIDPSFLAQFYGTDGARNWMNYTDANLDSILALAASEVDPTVRGNAYAQAQQIIMDQALVLPIRDYVNLNGVNRRVLNLQYDPYGWFPLLYPISLTPAS